MIRNQWIRALTLTFMCVSASFPQSLLAAGPSATAARSNSVIEVALQEGGVLEGQLVDSQQMPISEQLVRVHFQGEEVASAKTDGEGRFGVRGLRGGSHILETAHGSQVYQLWAPNTAPPHAQTSVTMVGAPEVQIVRGQYNDGLSSLETLLILGLIAGGIVWGVTANSGDCNCPPE